MPLLPLLLLLLLLLLLPGPLGPVGAGLASSPPPARVAIIGAGISGASCALHLRELLGPAADDGGVLADVYEASGVVGGRLRHVIFDNVSLDVGGTIVHEDNALMLGLAAAAGVHLSRPGFASPDGMFGVWNGSAFLFRSDPASAVRTGARALWRYGLAPLRAALHSAWTKDRFLDVYALLDARPSGFASAVELFSAVGLLHLTQTSGREYARRARISECWVDELAAALVQNNYGQLPRTANALSMFVSLVGSSDELRACDEGWDEVVRRTLVRSGVRLHLAAPVVGVEEATGGRGGFLVHTRAPAGASTPHAAEDGGAGPAEQYDCVVIASPLEVGGSKISLPPAAAAATSSARVRRAFVSTHVTLVSGTFACEHFGLPDSCSVSFVGTDGHEARFRSLQLVGHGSQFPVWKLFSDRELDDDTLRVLFRHVAHTERLRWDAYPDLRPRDPELWPPFALRPEGLFYTSAMETPFSTMETQALAGKNVALLVAAHLRRDRGTARGAATGHEEEVPCYDCSAAV